MTDAERAAWWAERYRMDIDRALAWPAEVWALRDDGCLVMSPEPFVVHLSRLVDWVRSAHAAGRLSEAACTALLARLSDAAVA